MKRILAVGVLAVMVAATAQAQLTAAGSNFTGPGGGGGGATATVGAFLPTARWSTGYTGTGLPSYGGVAAFATATSPANVTIGSLTVSVSAAAQNLAAGAVLGTPNSAGVTAFANSLTGVSGSAATALGNAMAALGEAFRGYADRNTNLSHGGITPLLNSAISAFNAAVNSLPAGAPVPQSLIAARAILSAYAR